MRRWLVRILLLFVVLLVIAGMSVHLVLHSDIPRRIVLSVLQDETGLRIDADSLRTTWMGETTITNLSVALPLERDPFLTAQRVRVSHTNLFMLVLTRRLEIAVAEVDQPFAQIAPDERGVWNLFAAADLIAERQAGRPAADPAAIVLPEVAIRAARFDIQAPDGSMIRYEPLEITGVPDAQLAWSFTVTILPHVAVTGRIAPGATWSHTVNFDVDQIPMLIEPWLPQLPEPLRVAGVWQGQVRDAQLTGQLRLSEVLAGEGHLHGEVDVALRGNELVIQPAALTLAMPGSPADGARVSGGMIRTDGRRVRMERVLAQHDDTRAQLNGEYDLDEECGDLLVRWIGRLAELVDHEGSLTMAFSLPQFGRMSATGMLVMHGTSPYGAWESRFALDASGHTWQTLKARLTADRLHWMDDEGEIDLSGLSVMLTGDWPVLTLSHVMIPGAQTSGTGRIDLESQDWSLALNARQWQLPRMGVPRFDLAANARGRGQRVDDSNVTLTMSPHELVLTGRYWPDHETPLSARLEARTVLRADDGFDLVGRFGASLELAGTIEPFDLTMTGDATGREMVLDGKSLRPLDLPWQGELSREALTFQAIDFTFADGSWNADGRFGLDDRLLEFSLNGRQMSIARLLELADFPFELSGRADAAVALILPQLDFDRLELDGMWTAHDLAGALGELAVSPVPIEGRGHITLRDQLVSLHEMTLTQGEGAMIGELRIDLKQKEQVQLDLVMRRWRTELPLADDGMESPQDTKALTGRHEGMKASRDQGTKGASASGHSMPQCLDASMPSPSTAPALQPIAITRPPSAARNTLTTITSGSASLLVNVETLTADGGLDATTDLALRGHPIGRFSLEGSMNGRDLHLSHLAADALGGRLDGGGTIVLDADRWLQSTLDLEWRDIELHRLSTPLPELESLRGTSHGHVSMRRAASARALEPMRLDVTMDFDGGAFDELTIERAMIEAYVGPRRSVLQLRADVADGMIDLWGRISKHGGEVYVHGHIMLDRLDLNQIVRAARLVEEDTPGRISGRGSAGGYPFNNPAGGGRRLFGEARLELEESDLLNVPLFSSLYNALRLDFRTPDPRGIGAVTARLEGDALEIAPLTYYNRGVDVIARVRVHNVWLREHSPVSGVAGGIVRPLRDINLPLIGRLDEIIGAIQTNTASVRISGTLDETRIEVVPFAEFTSAISRILRGTVE